jgi:hypothetical protein
MHYSGSGSLVRLSAVMVFNSSSISTTAAAAAATSADQQPALSTVYTSGDDPISSVRPFVPALSAKKGS